MLADTREYLSSVTDINNLLPPPPVRKVESFPAILCEFMSMKVCNWKLNFVHKITESDRGKFRIAFRDANRMFSEGSLILCDACCSLAELGITLCQLPFDPTAFLTDNEWAPYSPNTTFMGTIKHVLVSGIKSLQNTGGNFQTRWGILLHSSKFSCMNTYM